MYLPLSQIVPVTSLHLQPGLVSPHTDVLAFNGSYILVFTSTDIQRYHSDCLIARATCDDYQNILTTTPAFWVSWAASRHSIVSFHSTTCAFLDMAPLAARQLFAIEVSTRASSVASILGSLFIISTFLCFPYFRKPITRLIFYATWGNIVTNAATLISVSAIPADGTTISPLCEAQAFLIQWFMLADPFWASTYGSWRMQITDSVRCFAWP